MTNLVIVLCAFAIQLVTGAYYLPGISPQTYQQHDPVKLFVTKLTSTKTQAPYDYYSLPYCKPASLDLQKENLGQVISGDRIEASTYKLETKVPKACEVACVVKLNKAGSTSFIRAIDEEYRVHWVVDNLPVGMFNTNADRETVFSRGFPVGFHTGPAKKQFKHYIYNHVRIIIQYHDDKGDSEDVTTKIVGFRVEPMSIKHTWEGDDFKEGTTVLKTCNSQTPPTNDPKNYMSVDKIGDTVVFSYDVFWEKSDTEWTSRWDAYLLANAPNDKVRQSIQPLDISISYILDVRHPRYR